MHKTKRRS